MSESDNRSSVERDEKNDSEEESKPEVKVENGVASPVSSEKKKSKEETPIKVPAKKRAKAEAKQVKKEEKEDEEESEKSGEEEDDSPGKVPLLDAPLKVEGTRERKKVERFVPVSETKTNTAVEIPEGKGVALGKIAIIEDNLKIHKSESLKNLHKVLYGRMGTVGLLKKNIRLFCGFDFDKDSDKYEKKKVVVSKLNVGDLKPILKVLDLEISGTKDTIVERLLDFLISPVDSGKRPRAKRPSRASKSKTAKKGYRVSDDDDDEEEDDDKDDDDRDEDEDEEDEEDDEPKKKKSKKSSKKPASKKKVAKKAPKKKKKKDSESEDEVDDEEDVSEDEEKEEEKKKEENDKESSGKEESDEINSEEESKKPAKKRAISRESAKKKPKEKPKPAVKPKVKSKSKGSSESEGEEEKENNKNSESDEEDDEPLVKKSKAEPPSDEEIKAYIKKILDDANLEEITMKTVCKEVYDHYPDFDITSKKPFIKSTVKALISG